MLERVGNMLEAECDVLVVTTNGFVTNAGKAAIGRGIAKQISDMLPDIPFVLGSKIKQGSINVHVLRNEPEQTFARADFIDYVANGLNFNVTFIKWDN